jgi:hypothetical protein
MKPVSTKALVLALLLAVMPSVSGSAPDDPGAWQSWQSSVVATNIVMFLNGTLTVNDFPAVPANSLVGVFAPFLPDQAVGAYALAGGSGSFSIAVYGNTGETTVNGASPGERLAFYYHDNVTGLTTAIADPGITYAGSDPPNVLDNVALRAYFPPSITAFDNAGAAGAQVRLTGTNFSALTSGNQVTFNGVPATVDNVIDGNHLIVTVPAGAQTGKIRIQTAGGNSTTFANFTVLPRITGFTPSSGVAGDLVTVDGNNFGATPAFSVGGTAVPSDAVTVVNDNQAAFTIPAGVLSGTVSVATSQGSGSSAATLTVFPSITGLSPLTGGVGDVVTISGANFDDAAGATVVTFTGGASAEIVSATRTSLGVRVPGGALDGPVTVSTPAGADTSDDAFTISTRHFADPVPTAWSMPLSGTVKKNGAAAPAGDEIAAYSVHRRLPLTNPVRWEKTLVAHATILADGTLSAMPVYGDDPVTTDNVEGCVAGEEVLLVLWSASEAKPYFALLDGTSGAPLSIAWDNAAAPPALDVDFVEGQRIPLRTNAWNLVSAGVLRGYRLASGTLPANQLAGATYEAVAGTTLTQAFPIRSIEGRYDRVIGNDGGGTRLLRPTDNVSGLRVLSPGYGYWVKTKASAQPLVWMTFPGPLAAGSEQLQLGSGIWTLVGYWGNERVYHDAATAPFNQLLPVSASDNALLPSLGDVWQSIDGKFDRAIMADGSGTKLFNPLTGTGTFRYLAPGYGYWIKTNSAATLGYPAGTR